MSQSITKKRTKDLICRGENRTYPNEEGRVAKAKREPFEDDLLQNLALYTGGLKENMAQVECIKVSSLREL